MRAPILYFGGKGRMVAKLRRLVPPGGRPYCEPFCGGASLFFDREPAPVEVLNDLDGDVVNLFRCLQHPRTYRQLTRRLKWTLYSRGEFEKALGIMKQAWVRPHSPDVERAWAFYVTQHQGFGGLRSTSLGNWGRAVNHSVSGRAETTSKWMIRQSLLPTWHERLMRVQIDCRDALEVLRYWDNPSAVFYCDPPYILETRVSRDVYVNEPDAAFHRQLVEVLLNLQGACVLSGYDHPIYQPLVKAGWALTRFKTACYAAGRTRSSGLQGNGSALKKVPRVECVWRNPRAVQMMAGEDRTLFAVAPVQRGSYRARA